MNCEELRPLRIAFMGYNATLTSEYIRRFCNDNRESVLSSSGRKVILNDGTRIFPIWPSRVWRDLDGHRFDQLILADDEQKMVYTTYSREISFIACHYMLHSWVPPEFQILFYNPFEEYHPMQKNVFFKIGISVNEAAEAFLRIAEATRNASTEYEKRILRQKFHIGKKEEKKS